MSNPTVSLVVATLNEGLWLEQTIATAVAGDPPPLEVVVVDDGSLEDPHARLSSFIARGEFRFKYVRNQSRTGSGLAKHRGCAESVGDLVVVSDSHMRFPGEWVERLVEAHDAWPHSVLVPLSAGFEADSKFEGWGARLEMGKHGFWAPTGNGTYRPPTSERYPRIPCPYGGCYAIPRHILDEVGGYSPGLHGYGCEEEYLALRTCLMGFDVRVVPDLRVQHQYRRKIDRRVNGPSLPGQVEMPFNAMTMAQVLFEDGVFERHYEKRIREVCTPHLAEVEKVWAACQEERWGVREFLQKGRIRSDKALGAVLGVVHPEA